MDPVSRTAAILLTFAGALLTAVAVGYIAHYDMGFTREEIRTFSLASAIILATLIATEYFGKKFRNPK
jgi:energy-converting hydrogenase Eha subunit G